MSLQGTDLALVSARIAVARIGAFRLGFCPEDVEGSGTIGPGEYAWRELKPEDDGQEWHVVAAWSMCADKCVASFNFGINPGGMQPMHLPLLAVPVGTPIFFEDTTTPTGESTFWHWHFGDGAESDLQNPTHAYQHPGDYAVTLWTSGPRGACSATGRLEIVAAQPPADTIIEGTVSFMDQQIPSCVGNEVQIRDMLGNILETTTTDADGHYIFTNPVVPLIDGDLFAIYVVAPGSCAGCVDTWDDAFTWATGTTQVIDIDMMGA